MLSEKSPLIQDTLGIANEYTTGEADVKLAASRLASNGPFGLLIAGEVLLEEGTKASEYPAQELFDSARSNYRQVISLTENASITNDEHLSTRGRSLARLAQFPAMLSIYTKDKMPILNVVSEMYRRLVRQSNSAIDTLYGAGARSDSESAIELYGLAGELSVLMLAQRAYLTRKLQRLALQSMFSEDHGGNCLVSTGTYAWDINTFTSLRSQDRQSNLSIVRKNTIQVRSTRKDDNKPLGPTLYIKQDLGLSPNEKAVGLKIIRHCRLDEVYGRSRRHINSLDSRIELLKDFLYTTEKVASLH